MPLPPVEPGLSSARPGDIAAGSWELLGGMCRAAGAAVLKSVGRQGTLSEIWVGGLWREARTHHKGSWSAKEFGLKPVVTLKSLNQEDDILCFTIVF